MVTGDRRYSSFGGRELTRGIRQGRTMLSPELKIAEGPVMDNLPRAPGGQNFVVTRDCHCSGAGDGNRPEAFS